VQIAGGSLHSLALKSDGTVVAWGRNNLGQINVPPGLSGVIEIGAGNSHNLALKFDGTVVAWGYNGNGQTSVPAGLNAVAHVAAGNYHSLALKSDGTVVPWGGNDYRQCDVPIALSGVFQIGAGNHHSLALATAPAIAVSRKTHAGSGVFDVDLPLTGTAGVECRTGGATNDHQLVVTYAGNVTVNGSPQAVVTSGTGAIGSNGTSNGGIVTVTGNTVTIPLTNVANAQTINVTLYGVNGGGNLVIPMSLLAGDVNGNRAVNASDVSLAKSRVGQPVDATNFKSDVNANGTINASDVSLVKSKVGSGVP
jgi:hypothetical protein